ncbi:putative TORTIFOLIA1-like protein 5 [Cocos nucifera]|uniref:Putative TORTIFOLIA1-like protein 5 n=1 Tax=Cocos nucifera TaxID=13894 RepID=A0A8K0IQ29_COCNU|nr:putative TORTIFOLIA1-like protein 5 [Cocos nucifera]
MASKPHPNACGDGLRQRVNRCLTKLSDRDTEAMAASELDSIAKSLTPDSFLPFLSAIADTRPADKTPLRRHSLRLISLLSHSHPASSLAPHLPRMLAAALRRLRDPDSSVRAACVDAVRSMAASHPAAVAPVLLRPLASALLHEQDRCAQIASAFCLAAAINAASTDQDLAHHLQRLLPHLVKLLRSNAFKAKPALLSLLGSVAGVGGASTPTLLGLLVSCLAEFLSSEDWAARKAAAEALSLLAVSEKDRLAGFKSSCLSSFENRRFDKVKIVRESMNRMLEVWKDIPTALDTESNALPASQSPSNPSPRESASNGRYPTASVSSSPVQSASPSITRKSGFLSSRSRDTEAMAASELDSIAKSLTPDSFLPFLSAIADTRPADKTPLRRHSLRLISLLSHSHPASSLAPHLPRMLAAALRRLRDPDSSVRAACVDAVRSMAASHPAAVAPVLLRPLASALLHEQDRCAQIASAFCLAAAINAASTDQDLAHHLQRLLPHLVKLLRSNAFKAKPALLSLLGSVAGVGGASTPTLLGLLVSCLAEFLSSEDWAARKAAAEALSLLAVSEKDRLAGFKSSCLSSFENRRFDKVKIVRESMNRMLEVWKDIPTALDTESNALPASQSPSNPSPRESASNGRYPTASVSSSPVQSASPSITRKSGFLSSRSPPPAASPIPTTGKNTPIRNKNLSPPSFCKTDHKQNSDWRVEIAIPNMHSVEVVSEDVILKVQGQGGIEGNVRSRLEARRMLFEKNSEDKGNKLAGLKYASCVAPFQDTGSLESTAVADNTTDDLSAAHKDGDLSLIRMQLVQIENQQSSLLELLQVTSLTCQMVFLSTSIRFSWLLLKSFAYHWNCGKIMVLACFP